MTSQHSEPPVVGHQTPRLSVAPPANFSSADDVRALAAAYGLHLDDWQHAVSLATLGERKDGRWAVATAGVSVPRQNGKNGWVEARELAGLLLFGERLIIHSAHEVKTSLEAFRRIRSYFENYDDLRKKVKAIRQTNGDEGIELLTGQRLRFMARTKSSGRGFSPECLILDEAQELPDATYAAILPALSAQDNPQVIMLGTPPGPLNNGDVFRRQRESVLTGNNARGAWVEWSAEDGLDSDDPEAVAQANPALGIRIALDTTHDERAALSDDDYSRERLGRWSVEASNAVIPGDTWALLTTDDPTSDEEVAIAVDVAPDRSTASVGLAGRNPVNDLPQIEVIERRNGVGWVVDYVVGVTERQNVRAVVIDVAGPAASLIEPLRARGVLVTTTGVQDMKAACGAFYTAAMEDGLRHIDQPQLNVALAAARKRTLQDAWAWHRKDSTDITPLVAVTLALWGLTATTVAAPKAKPRAKAVSHRMYGFN